MSENVFASSMARCEYELLIARLADYTLLPTTTVELDRKLADEWNQLTLIRHITIVSEDSNIEKCLFGCILRKIDLITVDEWNDSVCNGGKLHPEIADKFKVKSIEVDTLMGLLLELWIRGEIPLVLKTEDPLPILGECSHLNKSYIIIDSTIEKRYEEMKQYNLKVFSHIGDIEFDKLLKMTAVSVTSEDKHGQKNNESICASKCLHTAVTTGDVQTVETLLKLGQDVNLVDQNGYTPLHRAVEYKHEDIFRILLENQATVNTVTEEGNTPLITAIEKYQGTILKILLDHQADINFVNKCGLTALYVAALEKKWQAVSVLLSHGAIAEVPAAQILLFNAVKTNNCNVVHKLFKDYTGIGYDDISHQLANYDDTKKLIKTVSEDRASTNVIDECGVFPLHRAVAEGYKDMVNILLRYNANANLVDSLGYTPLHMAIRNGHKDIVNILVTKTDPTIIDKNGNTALYYTVQTGNVDVEKVLLQHGALNNNERVELGCSSSFFPEKGNKKDGDKKDTESGSSKAMVDAEGLPITGTQKPLRDKVKTLLLDLPKRFGISNQARANSGTKNSQPTKSDNFNDKYHNSLFTAIKTKNKDITDILLQSSIDVNHKSQDHSTPLHIAVETEEIEAVKALLCHGVEVNCVNNAGFTPLCAAVKTENVDIINILLTSHADINLVGKDSVTPLIMAIQTNNIQIIQLLLAHDADPNLVDECGVTPLYVAALRGDWFVVSILLLNGAYTNIITCGRALLFNAIRTGCANLAKFLLDTQPTGTTTFTIFNDITMIIHEVVGNRANVNHVNEQSFSPLHVAVARRNLAMVELLLECGANVNLCDNFGCTPLDIAKETNHVNIIKVLSDRKPGTNSKRINKQSDI